MKNFWKKYKVGVVVAFYALFLGVFSYGGIFLMIKNIQKEADEIQKKIIDNEVDNKNLSKVPQLMEDYAIFAAEENNLNVILEKESEIEFIQSLENLAKETGNEISLKLIAEESSSSKDDKNKSEAAKSSPEKTKSKEKDKEDIKASLPYEKYIAIQLELKGNYPGLINFLQKLENLEHYVNVVAFDLKKEENSEENESNNPFVGAEIVAEKAPEVDRNKEVLKSLIDLIVYIR